MPNLKHLTHGISNLVSLITKTKLGLSHPPVFTHATDPLEDDDWLRAVEKQLNIAQCNDQ
jgi:hypothetical protein